MTNLWLFDEDFMRIQFLVFAVIKLQLDLLILIRACFLVKIVVVSQLKWFRSIPSIIKG